MKGGAFWVPPVVSWDAYWSGVYLLLNILDNHLNAGGLAPGVFFQGSGHRKAFSPMVQQGLTHGMIGAAKGNGLG